VNAGALRERVTIQTPALSTADTYGGKAPQWTDVATVWASVKPVGGAGNEQVAGRMMLAEAQHVVTVRYTSDLTPKCRFAWTINTTTRYLYPVQIDVDAMRTSMTCVCQERVDE
jgi:SPP1 family predicted phage head-tail adaptor